MFGCSCLLNAVCLCVCVCVRAGMGSCDFHVVLPAMLQEAGPSTLSFQKHNGIEIDYLIKLCGILVVLVRWCIVWVTVQVREWMSVFFASSSTTQVRTSCAVLCLQYKMQYCVESIERKQTDKAGEQSHISVTGQGHFDGAMVWSQSTGDTLWMCSSNQWCDNGNFLTAHLSAVFFSSTPKWRPRPYWYNMDGRFNGVARIEVLPASNRICATNSK